MSNPMHLHYSEDFTSSSQPSSKFDLDVVQYETRNFDFWDKDRLKRSVNRLFIDYSSDKNSEFEKLEFDLHPLDYPNSEIRLDHRHSSEILLDFPAVFKTRVYGEQSVNTLHEWECVVNYVTDNLVISQAISLMDDSATENIIEIPLEEFSPDDRSALLPGVVFRLIIGFSKKANGSRCREAICYLRRRLPLQKTGHESIFHGL